MKKVEFTVEVHGLPPADAAAVAREIVSDDLIKGWPDPPEFIANQISQGDVIRFTIVSPHEPRIALMTRAINRSQTLRTIARGYDIPVEVESSRPAKSSQLAEILVASVRATLLPVPLTV